MKEMIIDGKICKSYPFDVRYFVSQCGFVYSTIHKKWLLPQKSKSGYLNLNIINPRTQKKFISVHRLVALTFHGNPPNGKNEINHIDGNKLNNHLLNIHWCSRSENIKYGFDNNQFEEKRELISNNNKKLWQEGKKLNAVKLGGLKRKEFKRGKHEQSKKVKHIISGTIFDCILDACDYAKISRAKMYQILHNKHKTKEYIFI